VTVLIIVLLAGRLIGLIVLVVTTLVALALGVWITKRLGGNTGDTYGAIAEVAEVVALLLLVISQRWL
jgi:adenosylcobinamide-GDP ribazoletransferase